LILVDELLDELVSNVWMKSSERDESSAERSSSSFKIYDEVGSYVQLFEDDFFKYSTFLLVEVNLLIIK